MAWPSLAQLLHSECHIGTPRGQAAGGEGDKAMHMPDTPLAWVAEGAENIMAMIVSVKAGKGLNPIR